jgi:hypothetical protein
MHALCRENARKGSDSDSSLQNVALLFYQLQDVCLRQQWQKPAEPAASPLRPSCSQFFSAEAVARHIKIASCAPYAERSKVIVCRAC